MTKYQKFTAGLFLAICTTSSVSAISADLWGGYNLSNGYSDLDTALTGLDTTYKASGYTTNGAKSKAGGVAFGADLWMGMAGFDIGLGLAYLPLYSLDFSATKTNASASMKADLAAIPVLAQARIALGDLYLGAGVGYSIGSGKVTTTATAGSVTTTSTASSSGSALTAMGMVGYNLISAGLVKVGVDAKLYMVLDSSTVFNFVPSIKAEVGF